MIYDFAFAYCESLIVVNLSTCSLLEVIDEHAFDECTSLMTVYFPSSLRRIGNGAFCDCHSLISSELPPTVQVDDDAFRGCYTLELRQPQVDYNRVNDELLDQRSHESIRWLKQGSDGLPIHKICNDPNITSKEKIDFDINDNWSAILKQTLKLK